MGDQGTTGARGVIRFRKLRIAFAVTCLIVCVLLIVLWVRSYWRLDVVQYGFLDTWGFTANSTNGRLLFFRQELASNYFPRWQASSVSDQPWINTYFPARSSTLGFRFERVPASVIVQIPHWFPILVTGALAAATGLQVAKSLRGYYRFSLRTLLIVTTLIAVGLGLAAYAARK